MMYTFIGVPIPPTNILNGISLLNWNLESIRECSLANTLWLNGFKSQAITIFLRCFDVSTSTLPNLVLGSDIIPLVIAFIDNVKSLGIYIQGES